MLKAPTGLPVRSAIFSSRPASISVIIARPPFCPVRDSCPACRPGSAGISPRCCRGGAILPPAMTTISSARRMMRSWWEMMIMVASPSPVDLLEGLGEPGEAPQVDAGLRLVKDHQLAVPRQNGGDLDALDLAAGEGHVHLTVQIVVGAQPHLGQIRRSTCPC